MVTKTPTIQKLIGQKTIRQKQAFSFSIARTFLPQDGSLRFELIGQPPHWITIDPRTGTLVGFAPATIYDRQYLLTIKAYNDYGAESQHFFLKVIATDVIEDIAHRLQLILTKKTNPHFGSLHPYVHDLLQYIFEYFMHSDDPAIFLKRLREEAAKKHITLGETIDYEDFKKVVAAMDAHIEQKMHERLDSKYMAAIAELTNEEFRNLFRQGSQPQGVHAIPVFDHFGRPNEHNWSHVRTVLDASCQAIVELRHANLEHNVQEQFEHTVPSLQPRRWPR